MLHCNVNVSRYLSQGGITTLVALTIANHKGEIVSRKLWNYFHRITRMHCKIAVNVFDFMPGCHSTKIPPLVAGFWYDPSCSSLNIFNITRIRFRRIAPLVVESKPCSLFPRVPLINFCYYHTIIRCVIRVSKFSSILVVEGERESASDAGSPCKCICLALVVFTSENYFIGTRFDCLFHGYIWLVDHINFHDPYQ
jgi:hypothetical protein